MQPSGFGFCLYREHSFFWIFVIYFRNVTHRTVSDGLFSENLELTVSSKPESFLKNICHIGPNAIERSCNGKKWKK